MKHETAARDIELILSDVDGVLTSGDITFDNQGIETKTFFVRDGLGIRLWQKAGFKFGILTARSSQIVKMRAAELGVEIVRQGFEEKLSAAKEIMQQLNLEPARVCYIGDDLPDLPVIKHVGLGVAVANATDEVRSASDYVTKHPGGGGAVREVVEIILKAKQRWDDLIRGYG